MRLAIFDLDGTITRHDTLVPYVLGYLVRHRPWRLPCLLLMLPALLGYGLRWIGLGALKSLLIRATLGGCRREAIERWTALFVQQLLAHGVFPAALAAVAAHERAGDRLVLMSASVDLYVPAIARKLGFHEVICTDVRWDGERLNGGLLSPNRRGAEKTRCLLALRQRHPGAQAIAYGNAASDLEHLQRVECGVLVNGSASARKEASRAGITCTVWR